MAVRNNCFKIGNSQSATRVKNHSRRWLPNQRLVSLQVKVYRIRVLLADIFLPKSAISLSHACKQVRVGHVWDTEHARCEMKTTTKLFF